ncbi:DHA2 family multidrug resistance protein-like MFS transporter [Agromyces flavus]|uniref:DHA2 family multidrug resistance protein-like MFS transporter n=1 Tax=Agromyces flavus TaxID=589382 RepID=A0A1H1PIJ7_9MICO|nr:MFS transporter [Agromyces flavus]MCP2367912.1 DHA2 family multidrug resistance protein-like MFS transporter [Agromyces flavus]GGI47374.1 MFS transporter [Agromyces flavus]SDS11131.1 MFS transporter, DHA2 family, multidrug resistance protein [Agromyces flavus]
MNHETNTTALATPDVAASAITHADPGRTAAGGSRRRWLALAVLMLPVMLVSVDNTVLSFALPEIARDLGPTAAQQLWIIDAYPLVLAALLVAMGSAGDRFGRRRMLLIGSVGFALVSIAAAFAPTAETLIASRAALGFFGAMLMPSTLSLLRSVFVDREQRRVAIAIWASGFAAGSALGPIVGGVLLEHFAWGSVFLLAVPVLVPLLVLLPLLIPESRDPAPGRIDVPSILLSLTAMGGTVYGIKHLATEGIDPIGLAAVVVGPALGVVFVRRQLRAETPMLDMRLFRTGSFGGGVLVNLLSVIALVGFLFFVSQHLQLIAGLSPVEAGLALTPGLAMMIIAGLSVVPLARRIRPRVLVPAALVISAGGYLVVALAAETGVGWLIAAFVLLGLGIGVAETVSNELILSSAPPAKAGAASAVSETAYELGAVLGTALLGSIVAAWYRSAIELPSSLTTAEADAARETLAGAVTVAESLSPADAAALATSAAHAFDGGVVVTAFIGVALMVAAAIVAATTLNEPKRAASE